MTKEQINKKGNEWLEANHVRREDCQTAWFVPIGFLNRLIERVEELERDICGAGEKPTRIEFSSNPPMGSA